MRRGVCDELELEEGFSDGCLWLQALNSPGGVVCRPVWHWLCLLVESKWLMLSQAWWGMPVIPALGG